MNGKAEEMVFTAPLLWTSRVSSGESSIWHGVASTTVSTKWGQPYFARRKEADLSDVNSKSLSIPRPRILRSWRAYSCSCLPTSWTLPANSRQFSCFSCAVRTQRFLTQGGKNSREERNPESTELNLCCVSSVSLGPRSPEIRASVPGIRIRIPGFPLRPWRHAPLF